MTSFSGSLSPSAAATFARTRHVSKQNTVSTDGGRRRKRERTENAHDVLSFPYLLCDGFVTELQCPQLSSIDLDRPAMHGIDEPLHVLYALMRE